MFIIREMNENEFSLLKEFLYQAIFISQGASKPPRTIIYQDSLLVYIKDFGLNPDDYAMVAVLDNQVIGVCWSRIMNDYGHIDDFTPSIAISVLEEHRGQGYGTRLLDAFLAFLQQMKYKRCSLSVQQANFAKKMYFQAGFKLFRNLGDELILVKHTGNMSR